MGPVVQVVESFYVAPGKETPRRRLWLSPLDLDRAGRGHTPLIYFYRSPDAGAAPFDVVRLKDAMAKALVAFYPLAGRLDVAEEDGRIEINCNGEGALFVVARCDHLAVHDFKEITPSTELRRLFVPLVTPSSAILAAQVTFLKCGGAVLGTAVHHAAVDGTSWAHFVQTWSALCRDGDGAAIELPHHDRTLLRARSPPFTHPDALSVLFPKLTFHQPSGPLASRVITIPRSQVAFLKRLCGGQSAFCAVGSLVWQWHCRRVARRLPPDAVARVSFSANVRRSTRPPLPARYCGNAIVVVGAAGAVRDISSEPLPSVASRLRGALRRLDDELVRSAVDYLEMAEVDTRQPRGVLPDTELRIVSWLGLPLYDADFGWGKPWVMSRAESLRGGYVYLVDDGPPADQGGSGAIRVFMCMEAENIEEFEELLHAKL